VALSKASALASDLASTGALGPGCAERRPRSAFVMSLVEILLNLESIREIEPLPLPFLGVGFDTAALWNNNKTKV
jgi:hypothetical protein